MPAKICPDADIEPGVAILDCCGICGQFPNCLSIDVSEFRCIGAGTIGVRGCYEIWTPVNGYDVPLVRAGDMNPSHSQITHPITNEQVELCSWKSEQLTAATITGFEEPVKWLCQTRNVGDQVYYSVAALLRVYAVWDQYNGYTGWGAEVWCHEIVGVRSTLVWSGSRLPYLDGPTGTYFRASGESATPTALEVTECNLAP